jgi:hypothetical protein
MADAAIVVKISVAVWEMLSLSVHMQRMHAQVHHVFICHAAMNGTLGKQVQEQFQFDSMYNRAA